MSCAISVFDMLKIGVGPSSSHTLGPWKAALAFLEEINQKDLWDETQFVEVHLYGSLALTGVGHGTDLAILLGLTGYDPENIALNLVTEVPNQIRSSHLLQLGQKKPIHFIEKAHLLFHFTETLPFHPNGMRFSIENQQGQTILDRTFYSIGGGFISTGPTDSPTPYHQPPPYNFDSAEDVVRMCEQHQIPISSLALSNEMKWHRFDYIHQQLDRIWEVMLNCAFRGCHQSGYLPGGLNVVRRAAKLNAKLLDGDHKTADEWISAIKTLKCNFTDTIKWVSCFAMAVNEENASFGRIVTAPTNGAAGVIPAVLLYLTSFAKPESDTETIRRFLLTASVIGCLFKHKATISAAMGGCQAEIGVSASMAAAALTEALGGTVQQTMVAAEIAMEHHLGLTCDPIKGLVQVPCIERNTMGAVKAITAANLALESNPHEAKVSLDAVIETMMQTALDMNDKYKETSTGGLATNVSIPEC